MYKSPIDGVLGFSQGAILVHILCALAAGREPAIWETDRAKVAAHNIRRRFCDGSEGSELYRRMRFAILISGFPTRASAHDSLLSRSRHVNASMANVGGSQTPGDGQQESTIGHGKGLLDIPSMHIWGTEDKLVPPAASGILAKQFSENGRVIFTHDKGHIVPQHSAARQAMLEFLSKCGQE